MTNLEQVKRLAALDYTNQEIADTLGIGSRRTVQRMKRKAGVSRPARVDLSEETKAEIRRLSEEEGWPAEEIMATLGVTRFATDRYCVRGPGEEWRNMSAKLSVKYRALWDELRGKM